MGGKYSGAQGWISPLSFLLVLIAICPLLVKGTVNPNYRPCIPRDFGRGSVVCVCNSTYCDSLPLIPPPPTTAARGAGAATLANTDTDSTASSTTTTTTATSDQDEIHIFTSSKAGQRLHKSSSRFFNRRNSAGSTSRGGQQERVGRSFRQGQGGELQDQQQQQQQQREQRKRIQDDYSPNTFLRRNTLEDREEDNTLNFRFFEKLSSRNRISKFWVNRDVKYQTVMGFGGAFTDAAGLNIGMLSPATQENLIKSYFGPEGAEYTMGRVPIGGTDFSTRPYTYDDRGKEPDSNLTYFALQPEDFQLKIPYIKRAMELSKGELKLVASPWSAPVWMKTNDQLNGAGSLKREFYQTWADYFVRFIDEYKKEGVRIWGVTTGNEPFNGFVPFFPFNCMGWRASDIRDWIAENLGPTLKEKRSDLDVRIIMFDDNKGGLPTWTKQILENNRSAQYVDGIGTHWYFDFITGSDVLSRVHKRHPNVFLMQTEACLGFTPWEPEKVIVGSWERGEEYLEAIIRDFRNWVGSWLDWNLALDMKGGPNWANLAADAAVIVNPETDEFFKQPIYYAISHVSKYIPPGSVRIQMTGLHVPSKLHVLAFLRPDNATVILFLNRLSYDARISLLDEKRGSVSHQVPARSIQTFVYY